MKVVSIEKKVIPEVVFIEYERFLDQRGFFSEHYRESVLQKIIPGFHVVQTNESFSRKGVLRGLHAQWNPFMGKLVRTVSGHMLDLVLDIRPKSPTFGSLLVLDMPAGQATNKWVWIPPGFAHGNYFIEDTVIEYLCTGEYSPGNEIAITPFDPQLKHISTENISIGFLKNQSCIQSAKDKVGITLEQWLKHPGASIFGEL